jgi:hypothetical protein
MWESNSPSTNIASTRRRTMSRNEFSSLVEAGESRARPETTVDRMLEWLNQLEYLWLQPTK